MLSNTLFTQFYMMKAWNSYCFFFNRGWIQVYMFELGQAIWTNPNQTVYDYSTYTLVTWKNSLRNHSSLSSLQSTNEALKKRGILESRWVITKNIRWPRVLHHHPYLHPPRLRSALQAVAAALTWWRWKMSWRHCWAFGIWRHHWGPPKRGAWSE